MATIYYAGDFSPVELAMDEKGLLDDFQHFGASGKPPYVRVNVDADHARFETVASFRDVLALEVPPHEVLPEHRCEAVVSFDEGTVVTFPFDVERFINSPTNLAHALFEAWLDDPKPEHRMIRVNTTRSTGFVFDASRTLSVVVKTVPITGQVRAQAANRRL